ncbi:MAG: SDR family oxidoreductase [Pseudomonadota bacterium]
MELKGLSALVTGAGSDGIGAATARALAGAGADIAIHHEAHQDPTDLLTTLDGDGRFTAPFAADLAIPDEARAMVREADAVMGGLNILVACAAVLTRVPFLELSDAQWDHVHRVNLKGTFCVAQEAARAMVARRAGRIILISSINQDHAGPDLAHYVASKGGVKMLARAMALELAPFGVTVNLIAPGTVETDLNRAALANRDFRAGKEALIPMKRIATPDDIARAAVYLSSPGSSYVTGSTITIDGGLTL